MHSIAQNALKDNLVKKLAQRYSKAFNWGFHEGFLKEKNKIQKKK